MDEDTLRIVRMYEEDQDILSLARYLKDKYGKTQGLLKIRDITQISIQEIKEFVLWHYYGGSLTDEQFRNYMQLNWDKSDLERNPWIVY